MERGGSRRGGSQNVTFSKKGRKKLGGKRNYGGGIRKTNNTATAQGAQSKSATKNPDFEKAPFRTPCFPSFSQAPSITESVFSANKSCLHVQERGRIDIFGMLSRGGSRGG